MAFTSYSGQDLVLIVPTKDRPHQVRNLLNSIYIQAVYPNSIVVVDYGGNSESVVKDFEQKLPLTYISSPIGGQIYQRNLGISLVQSSHRLIGFLDDDLVLGHDALSQMIDFWNAAPPDTGGVGFNIINCPPFRFSPLFSLAFLSSPKPGDILISGYNSSIQNIPTSTRVRWLGGGYTVWSAEILKVNQQEPLKTHWAIGEDLRFSYPIGRSSPLFVNASAKVRHEHVYDQAPGLSVYYYRGKKSVISIYYFVNLYRPQFSLAACFWMLLVKFNLRLISGVVKFNLGIFIQGLGEMAGFFLCFILMIRKSNILPNLED